MPNLNIPDEGLTVPGPSLQLPDEKPNARAAYPAPFAMKINLTERFLEELSSGKQTSIQLNTGKGSGRMFEYMHTHDLFHNELYRQSEDDLDTIVPMGLLKDKLELLEVVEKKSVDADLLALKQQMQALQKQKDKKRYLQTPAAKNLIEERVLISIVSNLSRIHLNLDPNFPVDGG
ncbi:hypothetical protein ABW21_db0203027 [Orbilia brochopaga]|nr:hypothetical protein ABW21_db0203027 [Drechslerella brochopaga]